MHFFDQLIATFIGILLTTLPVASGETTSPQVSGSTTVSSSVTANSSLRDVLLRLQERFAKQSNASKSRSSDDDTSEEDARRDSEIRRDSRAETNEDANRDDNSVRALKDDSIANDSVSRGRETEDEDEEGDDEDERHSSKTTSNTSVTPAQLQAQNPTTPQTPSIATFTSAQVATHATAASCYSIVNGAVYDLTNWIAKHPGGSSAIKGMCGVDASSAFNGQHTGQARPASELSGFKIGTLAK